MIIKRSQNSLGHNIFSRTRRSSARICIKLKRSTPPWNGYNTTLTQDPPRLQHTPTTARRPSTHCLTSCQEWRGDGTLGLKAVSRRHQQHHSTTTTTGCPDQRTPYTCAYRNGEQMAGSEPTWGSSQLGSVGDDDVHCAPETHFLGNGSHQRRITTKPCR